MAVATLDVDTYRVSAVGPVKNPDVLVQWATSQSKGRGAVLGFDFPIGLPKAYAAKASVNRFLDVLPELGTGRWKDFCDVAELPHQVSVARPFYPRRPGGTLQTHLVDGIGVRTIDDLLRRCDFGTEYRNKACALF